MGPWGVELALQTEFGDQTRMKVIANPSEKKIGLMDLGHREDLGMTTLSTEDLLGLDCYLIFLRRKFQAGAEVQNTRRSSISEMAQR